jgi:hypothetical protein
MLRRLPYKQSGIRNPTKNTGITEREVRGFEPFRSTWCSSIPYLAVVYVVCPPKYFFPKMMWVMYVWYGVSDQYQTFSCDVDISGVSVTNNSNKQLITINKIIIIPIKFRIRFSNAKSYDTLPHPTWNLFKTQTDVFKTQTYVYTCTIRK